MPPPFERPLTLRIYGGAGGSPRARHEFAVLRHMHSLAYPVPEPLHLEEDCSVFGGPFLLLEWVPGITLLDRLRQRFRRFLEVPTRLAEMHRRLHELPIAGFPAPPGEFLD